MLTITETAWKRLEQLQSTRPSVTTMRLTHKDGQVKCHKGIQKKHDRVFNHPGCPTLLMTPAVANDLTGQTLDTRKTERGTRLHLK